MKQGETTFCSFTLLVEAQIDFMYSFKVETSFFLKVVWYCVRKMAPLGHYFVILVIE